jgi:exopolyphosphatase/pppGpp-phosphohydrolase
LNIFHCYTLAYEKRVLIKLLNYILGCYKVNMNTPQKVIQSKDVCAIDFGSKNFKFVIGRKIGVDIETDLLKKEPMGLGQELLDNHGAISKGKMEQINKVLGDFKEYCHKKDITTILGVGTSAIRSAKNRDEIAELIRANGIDFEVAQGKREGDISYLSVTNGATNQLVSDMGSRSFQYSYKIGDGDIISASLKSGYLIAYDEYFAKAKSFAAGRDAFLKLLKEHIHKIPKKSDIYIALASNTMSAFVSGGSKLDVVNQFLMKKKLHKKIDYLNGLGHKEYKVIQATTPKVNKILPGLVFIEYMLKLSGHDKVMIAEVELPAGLIVDYFTNGGNS